MKRKTKTDHRHVAAIARDIWRSKAPDLTVSKTLGSTNPDYYLSNRLDSAFVAGWDAAERHYGHIIERIRKESK